MTKGGQNYKLGLVQVSLYFLDALKPFIDEKVKQANTELARLTPLVDAAKVEMDRKEAAETAAFNASLKQPITIRG